MQINRFEYNFLVIQAHNEFKAWPWSWNAFSKTLLPFVLQLPSLHTVCLVSDDNRELTWAFTSSPHPLQVHFSSQDNDVTGHWPLILLAYGTPDIDTIRQHGTPATTITRSDYDRLVTALKLARLMQRLSEEKKC